jgi:predicted type IV restriction endonuclease
MSPAPAPPTAAAGQITSALGQIADRIPRLRAQGGRISEQDTKRILITPTVEALGWDILDIDEVRNEYRHNASDNPVDYALFLNRSPVLFVEAKPLGHALDDRKWIVQTINYANAAGVDWCVLTNGAEWRIYKVHAQVEADQKLFTAVKIDAPEKLDDAVRVLSLLSRENMRARAIDELWQAWHVDRQVQAALEQTLQDDAFAALIRKRVPQLGLADIRKSLRRASITVNYPNIFRDSHARPGAAAMPAALTPEPIVQSPDTVPSATADEENGSGLSEPRGARRRLQSTRDLIELGRLKVGTMLTIRGRDNSSARVLDDRHVEFKGQRMTFNEWGQTVTGWPSIRIYTMACLPDGRTLDQLRDETGAAANGS